MNGTLEITEERITPGKLIHFTLQATAEVPFIGIMRIFKDVPAAQAENGSFPNSYFIGSWSISIEQSAVPMGEPFQLELDSLNYTEGTYYFVTSPLGNFNEKVFDKIEIVEEGNVMLNRLRVDMEKNGRRYEVYTNRGELLGVDISGKLPPAAMLMNKIYNLAINLKYFKAFKNSIRVDLYDPSGLELQNEGLMELKIIRELDLDEEVNINSNCPGNAIDYEAYHRSIVVIQFRTPQHRKYYEYDGELAFVFSAVDRDATNCDYHLQEKRFFLDDTPAYPPIPDYATYNRINFPGQEIRNKYPFDKRTLRIVRFGSLGITTPTEIGDLTRLVESGFRSATKGYFELEVAGTHLMPYLNHRNRPKVIEWYNRVPKTPNKRILNLEDPIELEFATLLYYYEKDDNGKEMVEDLQTFYPEGLHKEDITVYLFDGPGTLGSAMGSGACRVKAGRLYPAWVFYEDSAAGKTYHLDYTDCVFCGDTIADHRQTLINEVKITELANVIIHELGHIFWLRKTGISTGDQAERYLPFRSDFVQIDRSLGYFTRFEFMSYGRDRTTLEGMTYGDEYLERILDTYSRPEAEVAFVSHPDQGNNTISVAAGDPVVINLIGKAKSGLRALWYNNQDGPVVFDVGTPERDGSRYYDPEDIRVKFDTFQITLKFTKPGEYVYRLQTRDRLHPIKWQNHQSERLLFTIRVV